MGERRSLLGIASVVGMATLLSKGLGLARSMAVAAVFGLGTVADAHAFASVIPGFFLVVLAGQSGPLQSALVSVLSREPDLDRERLLGWALRRTTLMLLPLSLVVATAAGPLLAVLAPGLDRATRELAELQLSWMAPVLPLSGWIGVGMARLIAANVYGPPSLSPALSSLAVMAAAGAAMLLGPRFGVETEAWMVSASRVLAAGVVIGALLQGLLQWLVARGLSPLAGTCAASPWGLAQEKARRQVLALLAPATLTTLLGSINATVDLVFASFLPGVAAALGYAEVLVQAPRGLVASMLLVPLLPAFARLAGREEGSRLRQVAASALRFTAFVAAPLSVLVAVLAEPLVATLYERRAFDPTSTRLVAMLLRIYGIGMVPSLLRDVMVRFFYGLGDGATPLRIALAGIVVNAALDAVLVRSLGAPGLVIASVGVNVAALLLLAAALQRTLGPFQWWSLLGDLILRGLAGLAAGGASWGGWLVAAALLPGGGLPLGLLRLAAAGAAGLATYLLLAPLLGIGDAALLLRTREEPSWDQ